MTRRSGSVHELSPTVGGRPSTRTPHERGLWPHGRPGDSPFRQVGRSGAVLFEPLRRDRARNSTAGQVKRGALLLLVVSEVDVPDEPGGRLDLRVPLVALLPSRGAGGLLLGGRPATLPTPPRDRVSPALSASAIAVRSSSSACSAAAMAAVSRCWTAGGIRPRCCGVTRSVLPRLRHRASASSDTRPSVQRRSALQSARCPLSPCGAGGVCTLPFKCSLVRTSPC